MKHWLHKNRNTQPRREMTKDVEASLNNDELKKLLI